MRAVSETDGSRLLRLACRFSAVICRDTRLTRTVPVSSARLSVNPATRPVAVSFEGSSVSCSSATFSGLSSTTAAMLAAFEQTGQAQLGIAQHATGLHRAFAQAEFALEHPVVHRGVKISQFQRIELDHQEDAVFCSSRSAKFQRPSASRRRFRHTVQLDGVHHFCACNSGSQARRISARRRALGPSPSGLALGALRLI